MKTAPVVSAALAGSLLLSGALLAQGDAPTRAERPIRTGGVTIGTVKSINASQRRITVTEIRKSRGERVVSIPAEATITRIGPAKKTDLKVGDMISVTGVPLSMDAHQVRIGDEPMQPAVVTPPPARPKPAPAANPNAKRPRPRPAPAAPADAPSPASAVGSTRLYGRVTRLSPLYVALSSGLVFEVKAKEKTRFTRAAKISLTQLRAGDSVMVYGQPDGEGIVQARRVQVGVDGMPFARASQ